MSFSLSSFFTSDPLTNIIVVIILVAFTLGFAFAVCALYLLERERRELESIAELYENAGSVTEETVRDSIGDLPADDHGCHFTKRRLQVICDALTDKGSARRVQPPQLSDLHHLTEQALMSGVSATGLRVLSSVLLIVGICGTLFGVHDVLAQGGKFEDLSPFAGALNPSRLAVFGTIVLLALRSLHLMLADRLLYNLDRETMVHFLPALVPSTALEEKINEFARAIDDYNTGMERNMKPISDAVAKLHSSSKALEMAITRIAEEGEGFGDLLEKKVIPACDRLKESQDALERSQGETDALLGGIRDGIDGLGALNRKLDDAAAHFVSGMQSVRSGADAELAALQESAGKAKDLSQAADRLREDIQRLGDVSATAATLDETVRQSVESMQATSAAFGTTVDAITKKMEESQAAVNVLSQHTEAMYAKSGEVKTAAEAAARGAEEVRQHAQAFDSQLQKHDLEISDAAKGMRESQEQLASEAKGIRNALNGIIKAARKVDLNQIRPVKTAVPGMLSDLGQRVRDLFRKR